MSVRVRSKRKSAEHDNGVVPLVQTITKHDLARALNVSTWTLMRWVRRGQFPAPLKPSEQTVIWPISVIEQWQQEQRQKAEQEQAARIRRGTKTLVEGNADAR